VDKTFIFTGISNEMDSRENFMISDIDNESQSNTMVIIAVSVVMRQIC
jgi:hypothetical protein